MPRCSHVTTGNGPKEPLGRQNFTAEAIFHGKLVGSSCGKINHRESVTWKREESSMSPDKKPSHQTTVIGAKSPNHRGMWGPAAGGQRWKQMNAGIFDHSKGERFQGNAAGDAIFVLGDEGST